MKDIRDLKDLTIHHVKPISDVMHTHQQFDFIQTHSHGTALPPQLVKAQGPSRTCNKSNEEEEEEARWGKASLMQHANANERLTKSINMAGK